MRTAAVWSKTKVIASQSQTVPRPRRIQYDPWMGKTRWTYSVVSITFEQRTRKCRDGPSGLAGNGFKGDETGFANLSNGVVGRERRKEKKCAKKRPTQMPHAKRVLIATAAVHQTARQFDRIFFFGFVIMAIGRHLTHHGFEKPPFFFSLGGRYMHGGGMDGLTLGALLLRGIE